MDNMKIDYKLKKVDVILNKEFYSIDAIKKAINDFKDACDASLSNKKDILVSLRVKTNDDIDKIGYEFCNYVLALMKNEGIV